MPIQRKEFCTIPCRLLQIYLQFSIMPIDKLFLHQEAFGIRNEQIEFKIIDCSGFIKMNSEKAVKSRRKNETGVDV